MIPPLVDALKRTKRIGERVITTHEMGIFKHINRICKKNHLPEVGWHGLRHSFCSLYFHLEIDREICRSVGGWANDATMEKIYHHIYKSDIVAQTRKVADFYHEKIK